MRKYVLLAATAFAAASLAAPANASLTLIGNPSPCTITDVVCNWNVVGSVGSGGFSDSANFTLPQFGSTGSSITNSATTINMTVTGDIDFSRIFLTDPFGTTYDYGLTPTGLVETGSIALNTIGGMWTLTVQGSANTAATYGGNITFAAVPEPATWALFILGFGVIGGVLRSRTASRRRALTKLSYVG